MIPVSILIGATKPSLLKSSTTLLLFPTQRYAATISWFNVIILKVFTDVGCKLDKLSYCLATSSTKHLFVFRSLL